MDFNSDIDRIKEIIHRIEKRTDKGDIKFMCDELQNKLNDLKEKIKVK